MPTSLGRHDIGVLWSLANKEKERIIRRGRRSSESSVEFAMRASQYDGILERLTAMTEEMGPLPGLYNRRDSEPASDKGNSARIVKRAPTPRQSSTHSGLGNMNDISAAMHHPATLKKIMRPIAKK